MARFFDVRPIAENKIASAPGNSHRSASTSGSFSAPYQRIVSAATNQSRGAAEKLFVSCHVRRMLYSRATVAYGMRNGARSSPAASVHAASGTMRGRTMRNVTTMATLPNSSQWMFDRPFIRNAAPNSAARRHDGCAA